MPYSGIGKGRIWLVWGCVRGGYAVVAMHMGALGQKEQLERVIKSL